MMRILTTCLVACLAVSPAWAQDKPATEAPPAPLKTLELKDGDSIVFLGDSITHQRLYTQYVEDYFYTRFPNMRLTLHNSGVGGARAWDALQRFDDDVAAYKPKYVTILLGMNDGTYRPYDEQTFQIYRDDMTQLLDQIKEIGATAVPMTPTMYDSRAERLYAKRGRDEESVLLYNSVLAYYGTWLREMAYDRGLGFVDMWSPLNNITLEQRKADPAFTLIRDAVHPGEDGQVVMATAIINDLAMPKTVSQIHLTKGANGKWNANAQNGKLEDLSATEDELSFTFTAKALPWVLPEEAELGVKLTRLGHRYSREFLQIDGLAPGKYALTIDGVDVGTFPSSRLAGHLELQANDKTPQYQQALKIAMLNKQRNEGPIRDLRGQWSQFQRYARAKRHAEENPNDASAKQQVDTLAKQIEGMDERVKQANDAARKIEDQIFEINKPRTQKYVLKRVK